MNVKLKKTFNFTTGCVYQDNFLINLYNLEVKMVTATSNSIEQNIAYERIKYWMHSILNDGVLIAEDSELLPAYQETVGGAKNVMGNVMPAVTKAAGGASDVASRTGALQEALGTGALATGVSGLASLFGPQYEQGQPTCQ